MILAGARLRRWAASYVVPHIPENVNPASVDLTLGDKIRVPRLYWRLPLLRSFAWWAMPKEYRNTKKYSDTGKFENNWYWADEIDISKKPYVLWPNQFVLAHTMEITIIPTNRAVLLRTKSSTGRIGLEHVDAGYGDPGFIGQWTLELFNVSSWPIVIQAGMKLCQIIVFESDEADISYAETGRYHNQLGVTTAREGRDERAS